LRFQPPLVPTLVAVGLFFLFASLCRWQVLRLGESALEKERFLEKLQEPAFDVSSPPADMDGRQAEALGTIDWEHHLLLAGKYLFGQPGYQLIVPLHHAGGCSLVDMGWIPDDEAEQILKNERALPSERRFSGLVRRLPSEPEASGSFPLENGYQRRWARYAPEAMATAAGCLPAQDWLLIEGEGLAEQDPIKDRIPPIGGWRAVPQQIPHREYAITWGSLAILIVILWCTLSFHRKPA
jgi:cytochrome oxidase assembly protein ShyY1